MNGVQTRFKCKLDVKRCKRFVFPPSSLLPRSNALKTKAIRYFQTDRTLTRIVSPPLSGNGSPGNNGFASHSMQPDAEGHLLLTDYEGKKIRVLDPALVNDDMANDASIDLDDLSLSPGFKPKTLALCGDRWYATGDNDAINIYERQSDEWSKKIKTVKGYAFSQPARIYAQNDSVLWVSDTHSSKRTLVKMLVHKGEIRE